MKRHIAYVFLAIPFVFLVNLAKAQNDAVKNFTPADLEAFLKNDLKKTFKKEIREGNINYDVKNGFHIQFDQAKKSLLFLEKFKFEYDPQARRNSQEENLKMWNSKAKLSKAILPGRFEPGDDKNAMNRLVYFQGTFDLAKGTTPAKLKSYYESLDAEFDSFIMYMLGAKK